VADLVDFTELGSESLTRLGEDLLHAFFILHLNPLRLAMAADRKYISSISDVISRDGTSPTSISPAEAAVLAETFGKVYFPFKPPLGL
jgi:hypothetical protein